MKNFDYKKYLSEGKLLKEAIYTDPNTGKSYDLQFVSTKNRWELDVMKKGASIYSSAITTIKRETVEEIIDWLEGYNIDSSWVKKSLEESKEYLEPNELKELGYSHGGKYLNDIEDSLFNQPYFDYYLSGFIKGLQDNAEASQDYADSIKINDEDPYLEEGDSKMKDLESQLDFHTQMGNKGRASIIKDKIEKLRKLSNSGEIDGDEFLDEFNPLSKELKSLDEGNVVGSAKSALKAMPMLDVYIQSLENDIEKNGEDGYVDFGVEDFIEDYSEFIVDKLDS